MAEIAMDQRDIGLSKTLQEWLRDTFAQFPQVERVLVYGSRATGRYRPQSDIDLAVVAPTMSLREFSRLWTALDQLPILFRLDVSLWHTVTNPALQQAMLEDGISLYESHTQSATTPA